MSRYTHLKMQELILSGEIYISMNYENEVKEKILTIAIQRNRYFG